MSEINDIIEETINRVVTAASGHCLDSEEGCRQYQKHRKQLVLEAVTRIIDNSSPPDGRIMEDGELTPAEGRELMDLLSESRDLMSRYIPQSGKDVISKIERVIGPRDHGTTTALEHRTMVIKRVKVQITDGGNAGDISDHLAKNLIDLIDSIEK